MSPWHWYVYIIECKDGLYYTGITWNPSIRYDQHAAGCGSRYTAKHGFKKLVYLEEHDNLEIARKRELQIKDFSRTKKKKLIAGVWGKTW